VIVYLLRHGIAEDWSRGGDAQRALTEEGVIRLQRATVGWKRIVEHVDQVFVSPLLRAQETAAIFCDAVATCAERVETTLLVPEARPLAALEMIHCAQLEGRRGIACVGHEPNLGGLLGLLLTGSERVAIPFKKGMLAVVDLESSASMTGRLVAALSQRMAAGL
jgi:phosphohistidine phosphatase